MKFGEFIKQNLGFKKPDQDWDDKTQADEVNEQVFGHDEDDDGDERPGWRPGKKGKGKEEKPQKEFYVGDVLKLVDDKKSNKVPQDAWDFLMTYKEYTVKKV